MEQSKPGDEKGPPGNPKHWQEAQQGSRPLYTQWKEVKFGIVREALSLHKRDEMSNA
jgi:hypothetical protein